MVTGYTKRISLDEEEFGGLVPSDDLV